MVGLRRTLISKGKAIGVYPRYDFYESLDATMARTEDSFSCQIFQILDSRNPKGSEHISRPHREFTDGQHLA
jgi:hypothetical protein